MFSEGNRVSASRFRPLAFAALLAMSIARATPRRDKPSPFELIDGECDSAHGDAD
jgi:hypothetical protein